MTDMDSIESNLKAICRQKGLTLTDVANRMATSPSNLLSSVKGNPTISKLQDIASALQVSVSELLTMRPEKAQGIAIIDGKAFQLSKPASSTVQPVGIPLAPSGHVTPADLVNVPFDATPVSQFEQPESYGFSARHLTEFKLVQPANILL